MTGTDTIVDDHLLLRVLLDDEPAALRPAGGRLHTTGLWYHRLCRALAAPGVAGALSRRIAPDAELAHRATAATIQLPESIGLTSLRDLAWPMARLLHGGVRLNLLSLEALAAGDALGADLCLAAADDNRPLVEAARHRGLTVRTVP